MGTENNPFRHRGEWYWREDRYTIHGPFPSQTKALRDLLGYIDPTPWEKFVRLVKEFIRA